MERVSHPSPIKTKLIAQRSTYSRKSFVCKGGTGSFVSSSVPECTATVANNVSSLSSVHFVRCIYAFSLPETIDGSERKMFRRKPTGKVKESRARQSRSHPRDTSSSAASSLVSPFTAFLVCVTFSSHIAIQ